jgi:hypothetical protein
VLFVAAAVPLLLLLLRCMSPVATPAATGHSFHMLKVFINLMWKLAVPRNIC